MVETAKHVAGALVAVLAIGGFGIAMVASHWKSEIDNLFARDCDCRNCRRYRAEPCSDFDGD